MVGQGGEALGSTGGPHFVQVRNKHSFPPYGLSPNYTPPNIAHTPDENVNNSAPMPIEGQQPQFDHAHVSQPMWKTRETPRDHNLADFKPHLRYTTKGQAVGGVPLLNTLEGPQYHPRPHTFVLNTFNILCYNLIHQVPTLEPYTFLLTLHA